MTNWETPVLFLDTEPIFLEDSAVSQTPRYLIEANVTYDHIRRPCGAIDEPEPSFSIKLFTFHSEAQTTNWVAPLRLSGFAGSIETTNWEAPKRFSQFAVSAETYNDSAIFPLKLFGFYKEIDLNYQDELKISSIVNEFFATNNRSNLHIASIVTDFDASQFFITTNTIRVRKSGEWTSPRLKHQFYRRVQGQWVEVLR